MLSIITGSVRSTNLKVWALSALVGLGFACDKLPLLAPQASTISLSSNSSIVQANGSAEIRATVIEGSGTPVQNGTTVSFTTTLGSMNPPEARTVNGVATTQFVGNGQSGEAEIRAASGGAKPADATNPSLKLKVGGAAAGRLSVSAAPTRLPAAGGSSVITATVSDTSGNPLTSVPVTFSTTNGTLSSAAASTGFNGQASVTLNTTRDATVTAAVGVSGTGSITPVTVNVVVGVVPTLGFGTTTPADPTVGQTVTFTLNVGAGSATADPFRSIVINFGDGSSQDLGGVSGTVTVAHVYDDSDTYSVTATGTTASGDSQTATTVIVIAPQTPIGVEISIPATVVQDTSGNYSVTLDPSTTRVESIRWNFGDGTSVQTTTGRTTTHVYSDPGAYTLRVTVRSTDGNSGSGVVQVQVN
jgi:PKD domain/Bacterial Ig-like domain (group 1)